MYDINMPLPINPETVLSNDNNPPVLYRAEATDGSGICVSTSHFATPRDALKDLENQLSYRTGVSLTVSLWARNEDTETRVFKTKGEMHLVLGGSGSVLDDLLASEAINNAPVFRMNAVDSNPKPEPTQIACDCEDCQAAEGLTVTGTVDLSCLLSSSTEDDIIVLVTRA